MKTLWTPWRMQHVTGDAPKMQGCLFEPETDEPFDKTLLLLYQDSSVVVLLNRFPYTNGHLLVAPGKHVSCITELTDEENNNLTKMVKESAAILKRVLSPNGLNIGCNIGSCAGAGIADHLHIHIIPRWEGDHNFITPIAEVRTIPQHIDETFDLLLPHFVKLNNKDDL